MAGIGTYIDMVNPYKFRETIERETTAENPHGVFINAIILAFISVLMSFVAAYMQNARIGMYSLPNMASYSSSLGSPLGVIITFCIALFTVYLIPFAFNWIAKVLGGNGSFWRIAWPYTCIALLFNIVSIPIYAIILTNWSVAVCAALFIPLLILYVYSYYLYYTVIRAAHRSLSRNKAIATIIGAIILAGGIVEIVTFVRILLRI